MTFVYKACRNSIVTLQLLPDSVTNESRENIHDPNHAKFRTDEAKVIDIVNPLTNESLSQDVSLYDPHFIYKKGEIISTYFDRKPDIVCGDGIHYFKTYEAALSWYVREKNIKLDGSWRNWDEGGQLKYEKTYKNGKEDGTCRRWYNSGQMASEWTYKRKKGWKLEVLVW